MSFLNCDLNVHRTLKNQTKQNPGQIDSTEPMRIPTLELLGAEKVTAVNMLGLPFHWIFLAATILRWISKTRA